MWLAMARVARVMDAMVRPHFNSHANSRKQSRPTAQRVNVTEEREHRVS